MTRDSDETYTARSQSVLGDGARAHRGCDGRVLPKPRGAPAPQPLLPTLCLGEGLARRKRFLWIQLLERLLTPDERTGTVMTLVCTQEDPPLFSVPSERPGDSPRAVLATAETTACPAGALSSAPQQLAPWDTETPASLKALRSEDRRHTAGRGGSGQWARAPGQPTRRPPVSSSPFARLTVG